MLRPAAMNRAWILATFGLWVFAAPSSALLFPPGVETIHAFDDSYFVLKNRQKFINFRGYHSIDDENLTDPDDLVYSIVSGPSHGTLTAVPNRSEGYQYIYIPTADYTGNDSITFKVKPDPISLVLPGFSWVENRPLRGPGGPFGPDATDHLGLPL